MDRCKLPESVRLALAELKQALLQLYGKRLRGVYLYGSYARGDFHRESDVDVLVVLAGPIKPGTEISRMSPFVAEICLGHDLLISILPVAAEALPDGQKVFFDRVRQGAVPV